jgi:hypothetical protein
MLRDDHLESRSHLGHSIEYQLEHPRHCESVVVGYQSHRAIDVLLRREVHLRRLVQKEEVRNRSRTLFEPLVQWACPGYVDSRVMLPTFAVRPQAQTARG